LLAYGLGQRSDIISQDGIDIRVIFYPIISKEIWSDSFLSLPPSPNLERRRLHITSNLYPVYSEEMVQGPVEELLLIKVGALP
jgi:hypothetical protein